MKKEKLEAVNSEKKKERKEGLQGESPADKSMIHNKTSASATHFTYRSTKMWDKKVPCFRLCSSMVYKGSLWL